MKAVLWTLKCAVVGLAIFGAWALFTKPIPPTVWIKVDKDHNVVCYATDRGAISCVNVVLSA